MTAAPPAPHDSFWSSPGLAWAARLVWLALAGAALLLFILLTPRDFRQLMFTYDVERAISIFHSAQAMRWFAIYLLALRLAALLVYLVVALVIFSLRVWRRPQPDWTAWLASLALFLAPLIFGLGGYQQGGFIIATMRLLEALRSVLSVTALSSLLLFLFVFPDGRFVPPWAARLALGVVALTVPASLALEDENLAWPLALAGFSLTLGLAIYAQIYRYRRVSSPAQRRQTLWVTLGVAAQGLWGVMAVLSFLPANETLLAWLGLHMPVLLPLLIPLTLAASILRYRLWDIGLILRRTLLYGALSAALAAFYYAGVTLLQGLFTAASGQTSPAALVLSTLGIAALFNPLRRRLQDFIDLRFYRRKYDAVQALASFAAAARSEADLEQLSTRLAETVQETLQPETVSLWRVKREIKKGSEAHR